MFGAIVICMTIILCLIFFLERRTILLGGVFLCWAIIMATYLIITIESYEKQVSLIVALLIFVPFVLFVIFFVFCVTISFLFCFIYYYVDHIRHASDQKRRKETT